MNHHLRITYSRTAEVWACSCRRFEVIMAPPSTDRRGRRFSTPAQRFTRLQFIRSYRRHTSG